jgi:hypothetical protein
MKKLKIWPLPPNLNPLFFSLRPLRSLRFTLLLLLIFGLLFTAAPPAASHMGGYPQLVNTPVGPYLLSIWTLPNPLTTGESNFIAAVSQPLEGEDVRPGEGLVILGAEITLQLTPPDGSEPLELVVTNEAATNKLFYEGYTKLETPGRWQVVAQVHYKGQGGEVTFPVEVTVPAASRWWQSAGGVFVLVGVWLVWQSGQAKLEQRQARRQMMG